MKKKHLYFIFIVFASCCNGYTQSDSISGQDYYIIDTEYIYSNDYGLKSISSHNGGWVFHFENELIVGFYEDKNKLFFMDGNIGSNPYSLNDNTAVFEEKYGIDSQYVIFMIELFKIYNIRSVHYNPNVIIYNG